MSGSATSVRQCGWDLRAPISRAKDSTRSARPRLRATSSLPRASRSAPATRLRTMSPAPRSPHLSAGVSVCVLSPVSFVYLCVLVAISELQLDGQLHLPLRRAAARARGAREHRRDGAERRVAELIVRVRQLRVIQHLEPLEAP